MFRQLAQTIQRSLAPHGVTDRDAALQVLLFHPDQLNRFLEAAWAARAFPNVHPSPAYPFDAFTWQAAAAGWQPAPGFVGGGGEMDPRLRPAGVEITEPGVYPPRAVRLPDQPGGGAVPAVTWDHLVYAYMLENTRMYEIFARVVREAVTGERLQILDADSQVWLRNTEALFFRDAPPFGITAVTSSLRPDARAVRRNAYYRMFGLDLNHGLDDTRPYPYEKPAVSNREFRQVLEQFLREVWRGIENANNLVGPNGTDDAAIENLARVLRDMLTARRGGLRGALSREEFTAVATMSWFHLTLTFDTPVVLDLRAAATSPAERLRQIGARVGIPAHSRSADYLRLGPALSRLLWAIEDGQFDAPGSAGTLYLQPPGGAQNPVRNDVETVITHWSIATGHDLKGPAVTVTHRTAQVQPIPNGHGRVAALVGNGTAPFPLQ